MVLKKQVFVSQCFNRKYSSRKERHPEKNPEYSYIVEKAVNTLQVVIGQGLSPAEVQSLIDTGTNVIVQEGTW